MVFPTKAMVFFPSNTKHTPRNHGLTRDLHIFETIEWGVSYWGMGSIFPKEFARNRLLWGPQPVESSWSFRSKRCVSLITCCRNHQADFAGCCTMFIPHFPFGLVQNPFKNSPTTVRVEKKIMCQISHHKLSLEWCKTIRRSRRCQAHLVFRTDLIVQLAPRRAQVPGTSP